MNLRTPYAEVRSTDGMREEVDDYPEIPVNPENLTEVVLRLGAIRTTSPNGNPARLHFDNVAMRFLP